MLIISTNKVSQVLINGSTTVYRKLNQGIANRLDQDYVRVKPLEYSWGQQKTRYYNTHPHRKAALKVKPQSTKIPGLF